MKRLAGLLVLAAGCVADVPGGRAPMPEPAPVGGERSGGSDDPTNQTSVTATGYLQQIAAIQCAEAFSCRATYPGGADEFASVWLDSVPACVANLMIAWNAIAIETEIAKGRIAFDGTAAVNCLGAVAFGSCDEHWDAGIQWAESCYSVMVGSVPLGGACESLYACESSNCDLAQHTCI